MAEEKTKKIQIIDKSGKKTVIKNGFTGPLYGMGVLGALVYFLQHATTFGLGLLGVVKAIFWPAFVLYRMLELLKL